MRTMILLLIVLAGCVKVPPPDPGMRRETARPGSESCRGRVCRSSVAIGGTRLTVATDTSVTREHDLPGREQSTARRAAGAVAGAILRANDGSTFQHLVGTGRVAVEDEAGGWTLACDVVWVDEEERSRDPDGTDVRELTRVADGMDCRATRESAQDPAGAADAWRFRRGIAPSLDSVSAQLDVLEKANDARAWILRTIPMTLTRDSTTPYRIEEELDGVVAVRVWRVLRDDTRIAVIRVPPGNEPVLDINDFATGEEIAVLRLIVAAVARDPVRR